MASPQRSKMALYPEAVYGQPNTTSGGMAYQVMTDGEWRYKMSTKSAEEQFDQAEAPLSSAVSTVIQYLQGRYTRAMKTHGEELWWRYAVGHYNAVGTPNGPLFDKQYFTDTRDRFGSYTIVQDRFAQGSTNTLYKTVYRGCKVRAWKLRVIQGQPVLLESEWFAQRGPRTGGTEFPSIAPYNAATIGSPGAFHWGNCRLLSGLPGDAATVQANFIKMVTINMDNHLDMERYLVDGDSNAEDPKSKENHTGFVQINADYSAQGDTYILDAFEQGEIIPFILEGNRPGGFGFKIDIPQVHISDAKVAGGDNGIYKLTATGDIRWDESTPDHALQLTLTTEGSQA